MSSIAEVDVVGRVAWVVLVGALGCTESDPPSNPPVEADPPSTMPGVPVPCLTELLRDRGFVWFRSFDGKWWGTDMDRDIQLSADGSATLCDYGYVSETTNMKYSVDAANRIVLESTGSRKRSMVLYLSADERGPYLAPTPTESSPMNRYRPIPQYGN